MIEVAALFVLIGGFVAIVRFAGLVGLSRKVFETVGSAMVTLRAPHIDDAVKERIMRRHSIALFVLALQLFCGGAAAVFVPLGAVWALGKLGLLSFSRVLHMALSVQFIIGTTLIFIVAAAAAKLKA